MLTLEIREYQNRVKKRLAVAFAGIALITTIVGIFLPEKPLLSVALGLAAAGVLLLTTTYTMNRMVSEEGMAVGWVAIDYLVKVVVVIGTLLLSKYVSVFNPVVVAVALVLAILATAAIQVSSVRMKQDTDSEFSS